MAQFDIGISSFGGKELNLQKFFFDCEKSGIKKVELSPTFDMLHNYDYHLISETAFNNNVDLWSFHFPFYPLDIIDPSSPDSSIQKSTFDLFSEIIIKASAIGINKFVVHSSSEPINDAERCERIKCAKSFFAKLADFAGEHNSVICIENLPRTCIGNCSDEILELISADSRLKVCFDTNHLLSEPIHDFIEKVGGKIATVHISDYDFINERHWLCGEGKIEWQALYNSLIDIGYAGPWLYEVITSFSNTIIRENELSLDDIARNAQEIFNGKILTVLSKPKPNLGFWE